MFASPSMDSRRFMLAPVEFGSDPMSRKRKGEPEGSLNDLAVNTPQSATIPENKRFPDLHQDDDGDSAAVVPNSPNTAHSVDNDESYHSDSKRLKPELESTNDVIRIVTQPPEIVASKGDISTITVVVATPDDAPQLFVRVSSLPYGICGPAVVEGLTLVEVRGGLAEFSKLRLSIPSTSQAAQLVLVFNLCAVVRGRLQELEGISATSRPLFVTAVDVPVGLHAAAAAGDAEAVMDCMMKQELTAVDLRGRTALHHAALSSQASIVRLLLTAGCPVEARDMDGMTALHMAALAGALPTVSHLLDFRANPNAVDNNGFTPLHCAAIARALDVFEQLVFRGANIALSVGTNGATAAQLCPEGMIKVQEVLANKERDIRAAICAGEIFHRGSPSTPTSVHSTRSGRRSAMTPNSPDPSMAGTSIASDSEDDAHESDDSGGWAKESGTTAPTSATLLVQQLAATAPMMLRVTGGIEPPVFKDSPLRIRLLVAPNPQAGGSSRDVARLIGKADGRMHITLSLEDAHGGPVTEVAKGRRSGARIINQDEYDVAVSSDGTLELLNVRIREVSRNHAGGAFRLVISVTGSGETVIPAVTRPFHVLSERIRAPSYRNQISRQRERRMRRAQGSRDADD